MNSWCNSHDEVLYRLQYRRFEEKEDGRRVSIDPPSYGEVKACLDDLESREELTLNDRRKLADLLYSLYTRRLLDNDA